MGRGTSDVRALPLAEESLALTSRFYTDLPNDPPNTYDLSDYYHTLDLAGIVPETVRGVLAAWGRSPEGYGSWEGGFLLSLWDGKCAYVFGWCDTSGWGCQDDVQIAHFNAEVPPQQLVACDPRAPLAATAYDALPPDLNLWHEQGCSRDRWGY